MSNTTTQNKPAFEQRLGAIKATVWANQNDGKTFYSTSIVRSYKDGEEWKETTSFGRDDLPKVQILAQKAYEFICISKN